uniref:IGFBP N-terminal domain-containing protein n=1 Tax=Trichobilharzia regenti TaxID=157069 RepID=A0AA85J338_TRIRE|nr:unnamed protein product [Trichobilharzia regenti]
MFALVLVVLVVSFECEMGAIAGPVPEPAAANSGCPGCPGGCPNCPRCCGCRGCRGGKCPGGCCRGCRRQ